MYIPSQFAEPRAEELHRLIHENPLGMLVTHTAADIFEKAGMYKEASEIIQIIKTLSK
jgi:predicted FMN-binding regulatory protein PaiB